MRTSTVRNRYTNVKDLTKKLMLTFQLHNNTCIICAFFFLLLQFSFVDKTILHHVSAWTFTFSPSVKSTPGFPRLVQLLWRLRQDALSGAVSSVQIHAHPHHLVLHCLRSSTSSTDLPIAIAGSLFVAHVPKCDYMITPEPAAASVNLLTGQPGATGEFFQDSVCLTGRLTLWPLTGSEWQIKGPCLWAHVHHGTRRRSRENDRKRPGR